MAAAPGVQEVEVWFIQSANPGDPRQQWEASQRIQEWISRAQQPDGEDHRASLASICFQIFCDAQCSMPIRFAALTTLSRLTLQDMERQQLRSYLLYQFGSSAADANEQGQNQRPPAFLRNKAAMILMQHILLDVPDRWQNLMQDLSHLAQAYPELFLKTCETLLEDFLMNDTDKESIRRVKDILKGYSPAETNNNGSSNPKATPLEQLYGITVQILAMSFQQSTQTNGSTAIQDLQVLALETIKAFFMWTELGFLGTENANQSLELLLVGFQPMRSSEVQLATLGAWCEWTTSASMYADSAITSAEDPKLPIMSAVLERLHEYNLLPYTGESTVAEIEVVIEVAKLINMFGLEIVPLREKSLRSQQSNGSNGESQQAVLALFNKVLDLFFRGLNYDDIDVSGAVIPLASRLALGMEEEAKDNTIMAESRLQQHIPQILNIFYRQLKYPSDFTYDFEDDINAEEEMYRTELCKLFVKLIAAAPDVCLQFVCEAAGQTLQNTSSGRNAFESSQEIETTLRLIFHFCEGVRPAPGVKTILKNETFVSLLSAIHNNELAPLQENDEALCLYYETLVRYSLFYKSENRHDMLAKTLESISGARGLQHPKPKVRSRCCYLFLRLVKTLVTLLRPLVETAVQGISNLLANSDLELRPDDTLYLFEAIGLLLGKTGLTATEQQRYLTSVMTPHIQSIKNVLSTPGLRSDVETYGQSLSYSIAAIAYLSKGFAKRPSEEIQIVLLEATNIVLEVLRALPMSDAVRNKVMVFMQRMVQSIGDKVLVPMPQFLSLLIEHCDGDDILFVSQLFNQTCIKFKEKAPVAVDAAVFPFLLKCDALAKALSTSTTSENGSQQSSGIPPHLYTEQLSIQKLAYTVLQHIVMHNATAVLISETNAGNLEATFNIVKDGAIRVLDPVIKRTCLKFFRELLEQWGAASPPVNNGSTTAGDNYASGLISFLCRSLVPGMFYAMMESNFNERDAQQSRNVTELANILFLIQQKHGMDTVQRSLAASGRWPTNCDAGLLASTADAKALETTLLQALKFKSMAT